MGRSPWGRAWRPREPPDVGGHGSIQVLPGAARPLCAVRPWAPGPAPPQPPRGGRDGGGRAPGLPLQNPCPLGLQGPTPQPLPGPHGDTRRALRGRPPAEPLESAATARSPASAQCPGDAPDAPSESHLGSALLSVRRTTPPPPTYSPWCPGAPGPVRPSSGPQSGPGLYGTPKARPEMGARWETECECSGVNSVPKVMSIWKVRMVPRLETGSLQMPFIKMRPP